MNTLLTIRPVIAAAVLAAVIGTSALSVAQAGETDIQSTTMGAAGLYQPSPFVNYDNTWLTGTAAWKLNARWAGGGDYLNGRVDAAPVSQPATPLRRRSLR